MAFNTEQFSWSDITVVMGGRLVDGVTKVKYAEKEESEYLYGRGKKPHGILDGNIEYEGEIEIWQSELLALQKSAPDFDIKRLRFDITVNYAKEVGGPTSSVILQGCKITEVSEEMAQGDKNMKITLPLMFIELKRGIAV